MKFVHSVACAAALSACIPLAAHAQQMTASDESLQRALDAARIAALNHLSDEHRAKILDLISQARSGAISADEGAKQMDGVLSPTETLAVLDEQGKMRWS